MWASKYWTLMWADDNLKNQNMLNWIYNMIEYFKENLQNSSFEKSENIFRTISVTEYNVNWG